VDDPSIGWDIDEDEAKALLGTPNGCGVAWLLVQHRRKLGWKAVQHVGKILCADVSLISILRNVEVEDGNKRFLDTLEGTY
jgi:hypothetical protein